MTFCTEYRLARRNEDRLFWVILGGGAVWKSEGRRLVAEFFNLGARVSNCVELCPEITARA
jgi:hypothetical protein